MAAIGERHLRGPIGTGDIDIKAEPTAFKRPIHMTVPGRGAPFMTFLEALGTEDVTSRKYNWSEQAFPEQRGTVLDVYTDQGLTNVYTGSGAEGDPLYIAMTVDDASQVVANYTVMITNTATGNFINCDVTKVNIASDTTTWLAVTLLQADSSDDLAATTLVFTIIADAQPENSPLPDPLGRQPTWRDNLTAIMMEAYQITGTEDQEEERISPDRRTRLSMDTILKLRTRMDFAMFFSRHKSTYDTDTGKERRFFRGLLEAIQDEVPANLFNYKTDSDFNGREWLAGGMPWLEKLMEQTARYSETGVKMLYTSTLAGLAINQLVLDHGFYTIGETTTKFGISVKEIKGFSSRLLIVEHPRFSIDPALQRIGFLVEMGLVKMRPMKGRGLKFVGKGESLNGNTWVDGSKEGWFTEFGFHYVGMDNHGFLSNIGVDNPST